MLANIQSTMSAYADKTTHSKRTVPGGKRYEAVETVKTVLEPAEDFGEEIVRLTSQKAAADCEKPLSPEVVSSGQSDQDFQVSGFNQAGTKGSDSAYRPAMPGFMVPKEASMTVDRLVSVPTLTKQEKGTKKQSPLDAIDNLFDGLE